MTCATNVWIKKLHFWNFRASRCNAWRQYFCCARSLSHRPLSVPLWTPWATLKSQQCLALSGLRPKCGSASGTEESNSRCWCFPRSLLLMWLDIWVVWQQLLQFVEGRNLLLSKNWIRSVLCVLGGRALHFLLDISSTRFRICNLNKCCKYT